jgi:polyisoprenoid-binding protein YceI
MESLFKRAAFGRAAGVITAALMSTLLVPSALGLELEADKSHLSFTSTKNGAITEVHGIPGLSGAVDDAGKAEVEVDLVTVATGIDIRNERMNTLLFDTASFPKAKVSADVSDLLAAMEDKKSHTTSIQTSLTLHGVTKPVSFDILALKSEQGLVVATVSPTLINAADFGLGEGVEKLREIAGLTSISKMVPVTFTLAFSQ